MTFKLDNLAQPSTSSAPTPGTAPTRRLPPLQVTVRLAPPAEDCHLPEGRVIEHSHRTDAASVTPASPAPASRGPCTGPAVPPVPRSLEYRQRQHRFYTRAYYRLCDDYRRQLRDGQLRLAAKTHEKSTKCLAKAIKIDTICRAAGHPLKFGPP